jgi:bifunctional non-homologous end joining protein LigD
MSAPGDRLADYNARRDFRRTGEPKGRRARRRTSGLRFIVQKHAARRLHYDLRLEWDGVLLSWAVTRGPSPDPGERRLAVRTEDHPLSYADFEGTIPEGEYGAGTVMLWDRGTWTPEGDPAEGLEAGKLSFVLAGKRMRGGWKLVRMRDEGRRENWLLIKARDDAAQAGAPLALTEGEATSVASGRTMEAIGSGKAAAAENPGTGTRKAGRAARQNLVRPPFRAVQLATLAEAPPAGDDWLHETKFDGYRALAALGRGGTRFYTRSGHDWTDRFAALEGAFDTLPCGAALIDGEVMAARVSGSAFSSLQAALSEGGPLVFYAFDLISIDGRDLTSAPLRQRRKRLAALLSGIAPDGPIRLSAEVTGHGAEVFARACAQGAEGIVSKRVDAPYRGRRSTAWLKIKCSRRQEFVIGGYRPSDKPGRPFASLLLGLQDGGRLIYRGRVGTGFAEADLERLARTMAPRRTPPFANVPADVAREAVWVRPDLVAEIAFAEFTADGHVRHARFLGLRDDKRAAEVTGEGAAAVDAAGPGEAKMDCTVLGIAISSGDRAVFPDAGCTKCDVARHYGRVGQRMVALAGRRPLSLYRCPGGLDEPCFFQKHGGAMMPDQLSRVAVEEKDGTAEDYLYVTRAEGLVAAAQMGTIEFHVWGARADRMDRPDRLVFDLDPDEGLGWPEVQAAAVDVRDRLAELGLASGAIVTGGKGVHVWLPLRRTRGWETVKLFAKTFAHVLAEGAPDRYVATMAKSRREGRIFIDWLRNEHGATAIAPYSVRARRGAPVAVPVSWAELARLPSAASFGMGDMAKRLARPCPAEALQAKPQALSDAVIARLANRPDRS